MAQASMKRKKAAPLADTLVRNLKEISFITLSAVAIYLTIALLSYHHDDPGWSQAVSTDTIHNNAGIVGAWLADFFLYVFGYLGYLLPIILIFDGWRIYQSRDQQKPLNHFRLGLRIIGFFLVLVGGCGLAFLVPGPK